LSKNLNNHKVVAILNIPTTSLRTNLKHINEIKSRTSWWNIRGVVRAYRCEDRRMGSVGTDKFYPQITSTSVCDGEGDFYILQYIQIVSLQVLCT